MNILNKIGDFFLYVITLRWISDFLCFAGGANLSFLKQAQSERNKFVTIGIFVINTAILSGISFNFAIRSIFPESELEKNFYNYLYISIFWAFIIFSIDWGLIKTIKKKEGGLSLKDYGALALRIVVAILISFAISRPLEIQVFRNHLDAQIEKNKQSFIKERQVLYDSIRTVKEVKIKELMSNQQGLTADLTSGPKDKAYNSTFQKDSVCYQELLLLKKTNHKKNSELNTEINTIKKSSDSYEQVRYFDNADSTYKYRTQMTNTARIKINDRNFQIKILNDAISNKENECSGYNQQMTDLRKVHDVKFSHLISDVDIQLEIERKKLLESMREDSIYIANIQKQAEIAFIPGLITNLEALHSYEKENPFAYWVRLVILLLIIAIDTAPIFIKLLFPRGPYEEIYDTNDYNKKIEQLHIRRQMNESLRMNVDLRNKHLQSEKRKIERAMEQQEQDVFSNISDNYEDILNQTINKDDTVLKLETEIEELRLSNKEVKHSNDELTETLRNNEKSYQKKFNENQKIIDNLTSKNADLAQEVKNLREDLQEVMQANMHYESEINSEDKKEAQIEENSNQSEKEEESQNSNSSDNSENENKTDDSNTNNVK